jgi:hypothetical protein
MKTIFINDISYKYRIGKRYRLPFLILEKSPGYLNISFNFKILYGHISKDVIWFRIGGINRGVSIKRTPMLFSEKFGSTKTTPLPFGWRLLALK